MDIIEIGVPFSDPTADGPAIQAASQRALKKGATLAKILAMIAGLRRSSGIPIVLFGYYNPILSYGPERFAADAAAAGVDGILVVDLPPEEAGRTPAVHGSGGARVHHAHRPDDRSRSGRGRSSGGRRDSSTTSP